MRTFTGFLSLMAVAAAEKFWSIDWFEWFKASGSIVIVTGVALTVLRPFFDRLFLGVMRRNDGEMRKIMGDIFKPEMEANAVARRLSEANADSIEFIRSSLLAQGEELPRVSVGLKLLTDAVERMTEITEKLERSHGITHEMATRLDERLAAWERYQHASAYAGEMRRVSDVMPDRDESPRRG